MEERLKELSDKRERWAFESSLTLRFLPTGEFAIGFKSSTVIINGRGTSASIVGKLIEFEEGTKVDFILFPNYGCRYMAFVFSGFALVVFVSALFMHQLSWNVYNGIFQFGICIPGFMVLVSYISKCYLKGLFVKTFHLSKFT